MKPRRLSFAGLVLGLAALLQACAPLPPLADRSPSVALQDTADTRIGRSIQPMLEAHPGRTGLVALQDGRDAFAARMRLAEVAERSLDVQYYIWHDDMSGTLLFDALRRAAERGVRVRLLLDDNNTAGLDDMLAALDAHPNIEVRLFNPFAVRRWRALGYLGDFGRLNRRMHNKSFTADNQASIVGGRNVGDEYFDAGREVQFVDLDVLAIGPVVHEVSQDFDRYWASASAYPAALILPRPEADDLSGLAAAAARVEANPNASDYMAALGTSSFVRAMLARELPFRWADTHMVSDDPGKGLEQARDDELLWARLKRIVKAPTRELLLISPYFVPTATGVDFFAGLVQRGVKVTVLTNSLAATDVAAVHAGYAKWRRPLLEAGVRLYEMKRSAPAPSVRERGRLGSSSGSSLHAKTFAVDGTQLFVGSFNFDPRSQRLNTELGFVIDSPPMAQAMATAFADNLVPRAYEVRLDAAGALQWVERQPDGSERIFAEEPDTGWWRRFGVSVMSLLPIDWLL
jgi:putative cardiolipin synthase